MTPDVIQVANDRLAAFGRTLPRGESLSYWFDPRSERIEASATVDNGDLLAAIGDARDLVNYSQGEVVTQSRFNDFSPFWGGSALKYVGLTNFEFDCTSGFAMTNGSTKALVTAAHCGPVNYTINSPDAGRQIGTTAIGKRWCPINPTGEHSDNADVQLITGKIYDNTIYIGNKTGGPGIVNQPAFDPAVGGHYSVSGAGTYEHTNMEVLSIAGNFASTACDTQGGSLSNMIVYAYVMGSQSTCPTGGGDSGAPIYLQGTGTPTQVAIRGMHVGKTVATNTVCYGMRYTKIASVSGYSALIN